MNQPNATAAFQFGAKGETLARLAPLLPGVVFCDQLIVAAARWREERERVTEEVIARFAPQKLAVRSSSSMEDGDANSNAGAFHSLLDVPTEAAPLADAMEQVIASYGEGGMSQDVLIQAMARDVAISGVAMTRDLDTGGPYYVINYDDYSGRTDTVTAGAISKTVIIHRANPEALHSTRMRNLVEVIQRIEQVTGSDKLDIEFCITNEAEVVLLQVRPLAAKHAWDVVPDREIDAAIAEIHRHLAERLFQRRPGLAGNTTLYGEMPDWNPAEMIGAAPRRLAASLYRRQITDRAWSVARTRMGYRPVEHPLMEMFAGKPYINVRMSLNSFLPADLNEDLAHRLVTRQLKKLAFQPELHDKIEFEVAVTCRDFAYDTQAQRLQNEGFSRRDVEILGDALTRLTARALEGGSAHLKELLAQTETILNRPPPKPDAHPLETARALLDDVIENGTLPFSILARHGFMGASFLKSLVAEGVFTEEDVDRFMRGVHTVAADVVRDMGRTAAGTMDREAFLTRYGHLRPGAYDILSWRYDERPDLYLGENGAAEPLEPPPVEPFALSPAQREEITRRMAAIGFPGTPEDLLDYVATAIHAREEAKFAFTRGISDALVLLTRWGESNGLDRRDLSHLEIEEIFQHANDPIRLRQLVEEGREAHRITRVIRLPHLVVEADDIDVIRPPMGQPTFITNLSVAAPARPLGVGDAPDLKGCIALIESADPGFDWIFAHGIAGLVTMYGGANSHMAIRCAEFGLPAAIGCGERLFTELADATMIELNAMERKVSGR